MADQVEQHLDPKRPAVAEKPPARDLRQEVTDRMVASLDQGETPWERPWTNLEHGLPRNMATEREYSGGNRMMLMLAQMDKAYADPRFGTVKQINELGGRVNKGEAGHHVELWKDKPFWERRDVAVTLNGKPMKVFDEDRGMVNVGRSSDKTSSIGVKPTDLTVEYQGQNLSWREAHQTLDSVVGKIYTVFNVEQCKDLKIEPLKTVDNKIPPVERADNIMRTMSQDGLKFAEHPKHAFYSPRLDEVSLPPRANFNSVEGFCGTALHEIGHATGAQHRLNREGITGGHRFGSEAYAKEELRAELFSVFMAAETGIPHDEGQHKAYIQSWAKVLKQDKNEIFRAASEAGKAVDYVLGKEKAMALTQEQSAEKAPVVQDAAQSPVAGQMPAVALTPGMAPVEGLITRVVEERGAVKGVVMETADAKSVLVTRQDGQPMPFLKSLTGARLGLSVDAAGELVTSRAQDTLHDVLVRDGWVSKPSGYYEKSFLIAKDVGTGGNLTRGKSEAEKILIVESSPPGFIVEFGWKSNPIPVPAGTSHRDAVRLLDRAAKDMLAKEYAHLGVHGVRGKNQEPEPAPDAKQADHDLAAVAAPNRDLPADQRQEPEPAVEKIRLDVPYKEKEEAKALGAQWDKADKAWYAKPGADMKALEKWVPKPGAERQQVNKQQTDLER